MENNHYVVPYLNSRTFPDVDTTQFTESAVVFQSLMVDAKKIVDRFAESKQFAHDVMSAAQKSEYDKVKQMIENTGLKHPVNITFNPDNLHLTLLAKTADIDCCKLEMSIHW
ncbi:hypothetical protein [Salirhabdus salicampi]|uniref:hypothetical protein n=1 Tax=Salirhabdus salicampi TaxID=476102 RepID=UPI0020C502DF|nr:hypothetical protein [Salirhabdus salicampi]MCP8617770.1 hypothetical protein [Salirhabdus salicampi]